MADALPDQNTIWNFKEKLKVENRLEKLFDLFTAQLREKGLIVNKGQIVDASIVNVPVQRNSRDENDQIKNNETPDWDKKKAQHKDVDARWTSKNNKHYYGYKNHIKVDKRSKLITKARVTSAEVHDSQVIQELIDKTDQGHLLCADSAYSGKATIEQMRSLGVYPRINKKGTRNNPLSDFEKNKNNQELGHVSSMFLVI
jgi:IS5 family transposase